MSGETLNQSLRRVEMKGSECVAQPQLDDAFFQDVVFQIATRQRDRAVHRGASGQCIRRACTVVGDADFPVKTYKTTAHESSGDQKLYVGGVEPSV